MVHIQTNTSLFWLLYLRPRSDFLSSKKVRCCPSNWWWYLPSLVEIMYRNTLENYHPAVSNHPEPILNPSLPTSQLRIHFFTPMEPWFLSQPAGWHTSFKGLIWSWQISILVFLKITNNISRGLSIKKTIKSGWHHGIHPKKLRQIPKRSIHFDPHFGGT